MLVTSSSAEKIERARELGAEAGVDYTAGDWAAAVQELTGGGVDVVLDSVGATWPDSLRCLRPGGRLVVFGATGGARVELEVRPFYSRHRSRSSGRRWAARATSRACSRDRRRGWRPVIDSVRPLAEAAAAHERMEAGEHFGKLVLEVA